MKNRTKILVLFSSILVLSSCATETHSNPLVEDEITTVNTEEAILDDAVLINEELESELIGSWSTNAQPGQVDFNEDGTYKNCEFYNTAAIDAENENCIDGSWLIIDDKVVIMTTDGDSIASSVTWVFDNVIYLGHENEQLDQEMAWEQGMTKI